MEKQNKKLILLANVDWTDQSLIYLLLTLLRRPVSSCQMSKQQSRLFLRNNWREEKPMVAKL